MVGHFKLTLTLVRGAVVHRERSQALLPSGPEFVKKSDGPAKNDCERNAI